MKGLIHEIHRRSLWQVLGIYLAGSWVALQVVETLTESAGLPDWVPPLAIVLLVIGFPIVMATAFIQEGITSSEPRPEPPSLAEVGQVPPSAAPGPTGVRKLLTWKHALLGGAAGFGLLGLGTAGWMGMRALGIGPAGTLVAKGLLDERATIVLADFRAADSTLARAVTGAIRVDLSQSRLVRLAEQTFVSSALERMERPAGELDAETARQLAIREGLPAVIGGEINPAGQGYLLTARVLAAETGEELVSQRETADDDGELLDAIDELSENLRERMGESLRTIRAEPPLERVTTGNLEALRKYSQAVQAIEVVGDDTRGIALLEEAIELDPEFAMAWRKLGIAFRNRFQERARAIEALTKAFEHRERLTERERYLADAAYYWDVLSDPSRAITAYENLLDLDPTDDWALNNLGILYNERRDWAHAAGFFERALAVDSTLLPPYFNLTVSRVTLSQFDEAWEVLGRAREKLPGNPQVDQLSALTAAAQGDREVAAAHVEEIVRAHPADPFWVTWSGSVRASLAGAEGRLAEASRLREEVERRHRERGASSQAIRVAVAGAQQEITLREDPASGLRRLDEGLARYPLAEMAPLDRPYVLILIALATAGSPERARAVLEEFEREVPEDLRPEVELRRARGWAALAEGRYEEAIDVFRNPDADQCMLCDYVGLARSFEGAGRLDSAAVYHARLAEQPWLAKVFFDEHWLGSSLERAAELYDELGDLENAAKYYAMFVETWAEADEELQPRVRAAQARLEEIVRARG